MNENLYASFAKLVSGSPDACLRLADGSTLSFAQIDDLAARFATVFARQGCRPGDRVATQVEKSPEALALYLASLRGGFAFLPINTAYREGETAHLLDDAAPALVIAAPGLAGQIATLAPGTPVLTLDRDGTGSLMEAAETADPYPVQHCDGADLAILLYTSGTTGKPKGAMLSHRALAANTRALVDLWRITESDVLLHCLPLFHAHGLTVSANAMLTAGAPMIWADRFRVDEALDAFGAANIFMGVPTMYSRLLGSPRLDPALCKGMRLFTSGSAALGSETLRRFEEATGHVILERYGMSETGINASNPLDGTRKPASVGRPLSGTRIGIVDVDGKALPAGIVGEVVIAGDALCSGYWQRPDATAESFRDGWFHTGDVGYLDAEGYLFLVSRIKDVIITGGYNVYPSEVEAELERIEGVHEVAVVGVPHSDFGEGVVAVIVGDGHLSEQATIDFVKTRIAGYKVPKRIEFRSALPRNAMGKVLKNDIRKELIDLFK